MRLSGFKCARAVKLTRAAKRRLFGSSSDELPGGIFDELFFWLGLLLGELRLVLVLAGFALTDKAYKLLLLRCSTRCSVDR